MLLAWILLNHFLEWILERWKIFLECRLLEYAGEFNDKLELESKFVFRSVQKTNKIKNLGNLPHSTPATSPSSTGQIVTNNN